VVSIVKPRVLILGAGFGGLELSTRLSEALGDSIDITLIDKADAFIFGYSKLDVMFGHTTYDKVRMPYASYAKPGVRWLRETITSIDPAQKRVTTDKGVHEADYLIVALGAEYDFDATPGLRDANEFYTFEGAERLRGVLADFKGGHVVVGVCATPFKCPPAPSECALMLHDFLSERGLRDKSSIRFIIPFKTPVPPSPETSTALVEAFAERGIAFMPGKRVVSLDTTGKTVAIDDGSALPYDLFLGVPKHRVPSVVIDSGMSENGWIPVDPRTLATKYPGVYAVGDGAATGTPKAGVFAEGAAASVAEAIIAQVNGTGSASPYSGAGSCYIEFGAGRIGRVDVDFFSGPAPTGVYYAPSTELRSDKVQFGASRRQRWFGLAS
jgi:sulfide:quinone oxidoreductase